MFEDISVTIGQEKIRHLTQKQVKPQKRDFLYPRILFFCLVKVVFPKPHFAPSYGIRKFHSLSHRWIRYAL